MGNQLTTFGRCVNIFYYRLLECQHGPRGERIVPARPIASDDNHEPNPYIQKCRARTFYTNFALYFIPAILGRTILGLIIISQFTVVPKMIDGLKKLAVPVYIKSPKGIISQLPNSIAEGTFPFSHQTTLFLSLAKLSDLQEQLSIIFQSSNRTSLIPLLSFQRKYVLEDFAQIMHTITLSTVKCIYSDFLIFHAAYGHAFEPYRCLTTLNNPSRSPMSTIHLALRIHGTGAYLSPGVAASCGQNLICNAKFPVHHHYSRKQWDSQG
jgi:hypothetical protein